MLQAKLRVASGKQEGSDIPLPVGKFLVGREEDCHLRPNSDLVSRHHCVFTVDDFTVRLRDLGSTNGTFVNGERIRGAVVLNNGDRVVIGKLELDAVIGQGAAADTQMIGSADQQTSFGTPVVQPVAEPVVQPIESATPAPVSTTATVSLPVMPEVPAPAMAPQGDTQFYPPNMMPGYQVPVGYPPQYPQYGYPQGYPQMPGYYPQMGYPMPGMMPQMPMPGYPQGPMPGPAPAAEPSAAAASSALELKLPDPETTGAKDQTIGSGGTGGGKSGPKIPDAADQIIKQYMTRR